MSEDVLAVIARLSFRAAKTLTRWGKPQMNALGATGGDISIPATAGNTGS